MNKEQVIVVKCYGALQDYCSTKDYTLMLPFTSGMSIEQLRVLSIKKLNFEQDNFPEGLGVKSAFATEAAVLNKTDILLEPQTLSWLPPVCGG